MKEENLDFGTDTPKLQLIMSELEQANTDVMRNYFKRNEMAYKTLHSRWDGQSADGRKHSYKGEEAWPWENAADGRLRTVDGKVNEFLIVSEFAFYQARIQATAMRPLVKAKQSHQVTQVLNWQLYTHMRDEVQREIPLALAWMYIYGASIIGIDWEQERRLEWIEINLADLADVLMAQGGGPDMMLALMDAIADPEQEDALVSLVQPISPVLTKPDARKIVRNLRIEHVAQVPKPYVITSKPRLSALRIYVDVFFPALTDNLQAARWVSQRERVTPTELRDRIETEGYDPYFVDEAIKHKVEVSDLFWLGRTMEERSMYGDDGYSGSFTGNESSYRDLIELHHFRHKAIEHGTPCLYKTIFCPAVLRGKDAKELYAKHGPDEYEHGLYPYVDMRFERKDRPIISSRGIPELAYTWENEMKAQADGLTDRTSLSHRPPMIVPFSRVHAIKNTPIPGAVMGVTRPGEVQWMPLPPGDNTPIEVQRMVMERMDRFFPLFGAEVDQELKVLYRQVIGKKVLNGLNLALAQILALDQQYLPDAEVAAVVGNMAMPFHVSRAEIQGAHQITTTIDMRMLDEDYAAKKLELIGKAMVFKQEGLLFKLAMETIDPDAADILAQDQTSPHAMEKEKQDELAAVNGAMNGVEHPMPMFGNHKLRLQTLVDATFQSQNPEMPKRLAALPDTVKILQNRIKFFQNQIDQYQQNPQIGRALATRTFQPRLAPEMAAANGQG